MCIVQKAVGDDRQALVKNCMARLHFRSVADGRVCSRSGPPHFRPVALTARTDFHIAVLQESIP